MINTLRSVALLVSLLASTMVLAYPTTTNVSASAQKNYSNFCNLHGENINTCWYVGTATTHTLQVVISIKSGDNQWQFPFQLTAKPEQSAENGIAAITRNPIPSAHITITDHQGKTTLLDQDVDNMSWVDCAEESSGIIDCSIVKP